MRLFRWLWLVLSLLAIALFVADFIDCYARLPQQLAIHFDGRGAPDGWGAKDQFGLSILLAFSIVSGILLLLPVLVKVLPAARISVPDAAYWLAPERAAATKEMMLQRTGWLACATILLTTSVFRAILHANLQPQPRVDGIPLYVGIYFGFFVVWIAEVIWRFGLSKKPGAVPS